MLLILLCATSCGCRGRNPNFVPTKEDARFALSCSLQAWREGKQVGEIAYSKPTIFVSDSNRKVGQKLIDFRILGETPGLSGRTYAVELELDFPSERKKAEYIVVGIDPLWVFRREDYELLMHWDHHMSQKFKQDNQK